MSYGDYDGPDKPGKGMEGRNCNRTSCQASPAIWFNHGSRHWYCEDCRRDIEFDYINLGEWNSNWYPKVGHPMFETRKMIDQRKEANV